MVENVNSKKLVGNICLHKQLVPERLFLRRNLRHILDSHEQRLQYVTNAGSHEDMIANEQRISGWDFPTREMLMDLTKGEKPILQLDSLQIRHPRSKAKIHKRLRTRRSGGDDDDLSWLPDPESEFRVPCRVGITVLDTRGNGTNKKITIVQTVAGTVVQSRNSGGLPTFNVELREPFLIEHDKFFVAEETGTNGYRTWKRTITAKYGLEVQIYCQNSDDTAKLLSCLEHRAVDAYRNLAGNEGVLKAAWENLPECPPDDHLLAIKYARGHKLIELDYKLEVSMGWTRKRESPLQRYNQKLAEAQKVARQLPTPSASDDMEKEPSKKFKIYYNFSDGLTTKTTTVEGLFCPFCPNGPKQREHVSFDRYRLHLLTFHDHFKFEIIEPEEDGSSTIRRTLWISLAPEETEAKVDDRKNKHETIVQNWVAPSRPFSVSGYWRGTDKWGRPGKARSGTRKGKSARDRDRDYMVVPTPQPIRKRPAPDEVDDLPEHRPTKRKVPYVPHVSFYHTTSKQALNAGDYVADSDEYVDESWLEQNQTFGLEELGITGAAQAFTSAFNQHLAREQSDSRVLIKEALVRFTRRHHERLQDIEWQRQFRAKLNQIREAGIIGDDVVAYCVRRLEAQSEAGTGDVEMESVGGAEDEDARGKAGLVNGGTLERSRKKWTGDTLTSREARGSSKGKAPMVHDDTATSNTSTDRTSASGDGSSKDGTTAGIVASAATLCLCGSSAAHVRASIACSNPVSSSTPPTYLVCLLC